MTFRNDTSYVKVPVATKEEGRMIKSGLSDVINVEVLAGLGGKEVFGKPTRKIE